MQSSLRIGRLGPLVIHLHYTWLLATVLILWGVALIWLPENYPGQQGLYYWLVAIGAVLLFLVSVILHELAHANVARTGPRNVNLFPFGAATPFKQQSLEPGRALISALVGPLFSLVLGGALLLVSGWIADTDGFFSGIKALLTILGLMNLGLGLINLIPGIPFDGGWVLTAAVYWFTGDRDAGMRLATLLGGVAALALVLLGLWLGFTTEFWLMAFAFVLLGWAAREAATAGKQRGLMRDMLEQLKARSFMDRTRPSDAVPATYDVARMVKSHPHTPPQVPLEVVDEQGKLAGVITLSAADRLLQGTWPATPVRALMTQASELRTLHPDSTLTQVLTLAEELRGTELEGSPIPLVEGGRLVGSIDPGRLDVFKEAGQEFGVEETARESTGGFMSRFASALPALMVVAAMALLGNLALRTNPADISDAITNATKKQITFSNFTPADESIVELDSTQISVQMVSAKPITTATLTLNGQPIGVQIEGASSLTKTLVAELPGLTLGVHNVSVTASTEGGKPESATWQFRVGSMGSAEATPTLAPPVSRRPITVTRRLPALGRRILAGDQSQPIGLQVESNQAPGSVKVTLNGEELGSKVTPVDGVEDRFLIEADAPTLQPGRYVARVEMGDDIGPLHSVEWTFSAMQPGPNNAYFKETGYFVSQPFLTYWQENGGLAIFGYPISDVIQETDKETGAPYIAQYFERARFEQHPATGDAVVLGRLGALLKEPEPGVEPLEGAQFFPETGHNLRGPFLKYWQENGGLAVFGYPITEEQIEKSPLDGKEYTVQYFERNRLELHPEHAGTPFEVQLGQLGRQLYTKNYSR